MKKTHHFVTLDALRGVAALVVFQFHFPEMFGRNVFPRGYLAVDFFFLLSGFVLAVAYQGRLDGGWTTASFLRVRFNRLYPLYLLGLVTGAAGAWIRHHAGRGAGTGSILLFLAIGAILLPMPPQVGAAADYLFPLDRPLWSLSYEALANAAHALFLRRRSLRFLGAVVAVAGAAMVAAGLWAGDLAFGVKWPLSPYAVTRVLFSYTAGIALQRLWAQGRLRLRSTPLVPVALLLVPMLFAPQGRAGAWYDLAVTMLLFPLILLLGAACEPPRSLRTVFSVLGTSSYAVYVLHQPLMEFLKRGWGHFRHHDAELDAPWSGLVFLLCVVLCALLADRLYDVPVRAWLRRRRA